MAINAPDLIPTGTYRITATHIGGEQLLLEVVTQQFAGPEAQDAAAQSLTDVLNASPDWVVDTAMKVYAGTATITLTP